MKTPMLLKIILAATLMPLFSQLHAQDEESSKFSAGADFYSNYIWRGSKLATGPAFQPSVKFESGALTIGVWGSFDASGYTEADPYISVALPLGFSIGLSDYYSPDLPLFETSDTSGSHALELNTGFSLGGLSLSANYIFNEAGGILSTGSDLYFQAGYDFGVFNVFIGAGDGWHTTDGEFNVCNIGLGTTKEIKITDTFSVPVTGQVVVNPEREALYVVVGFSL